MVDVSVVASIAAAANRIGSTLIEEAKYLYGAKDYVRSLQRDLVYMQQLLEDVDANPHLTHQDGQLRNFAQDIRELALRAEDAINSYIFDVATKTNRLGFFLKFPSLPTNPYRVHVLIKEIETIQQDIQKAKQRFDTFGIVLKTSGNSGSSSSSWPTHAENYIHLDDEVVVGIDDDISRLLKRLVDLEDDFNVLAIVGTGGAGKTILAAQLYNHPQVKSMFPHKAFVSISQQWSRIYVLQRIFEEVKGDDVITFSNKGLARELHDFLKDKQCLIVLDDMWKTKAWDDIYPILPRSNKGCRVIITTRIEEVPLYVDSKCVIHEPQLLTVDQKWELFSKIAMEGRVGIEKNVEFETLGRQMLEKCEGLPLAVVTLAGVLRTKQEWYQWEEISKAYLEYILKGKGKLNYGVVEDMLGLPAYLKPCLLYFAIFLHDWEFLANSILGMWIAEGFITKDLQIGQETLEDIAMRLLEELARRCILQVTIRNIKGEIENFRVHDLMREFCIKKAKEYHFIGVVSSTFGSSKPRRRGVFLRDDGYQVKVPNGLVGNMENLRGLTLPRALNRNTSNRLGLNGPKNLQWLWTSASKLMTKELPTLSTSVNHLKIYDIQQEEELEALYQWPGIGEHSLRRLKLIVNNSSEFSTKAMVFDLEKLRGCTTLWQLVLDSPLARNGNGNVIHFPPNLVRLSLYRSAIKGDDDLIPVLGALRKLKELTLGWDSYLGTQLICTRSAFQQLQVLRLRGLVNLEEWRMEEGAMARLRSLRIEDCLKLKRLLVPERLRSITTLNESKITETPEKLPSMRSSSTQPKRFPHFLNTFPRSQALDEQ